MADALADDDTRRVRRTGFGLPGARSRLGRRRERGASPHRTDQRSMTSNAEVVVVGAGIAGIAAA
jgi:hypothetical protein